MLATISAWNIRVWWFFLLLLSSTVTFGQTTRVEQLLEQLNKNKADTAQIAVMRKLSAAYSKVDPIKKFYYANQYRLLAEKNNIDSTIADGYLDMGISYAIRTKLDSAMHYFKLGHDVAKSSNYTKGLARSYVNIGYASDLLDRKREAVEYYENALKMYKGLKHSKGINQCITNLGSIYFDLKQYKTAQGYFQQVYESLKDGPEDQIALGNVLFSLGACARTLGENRKSMELYQRSLAIREKIGDLNGIALSNWGVGQLYLQKKEYKSALPYLDVALKHNRDLKNIYHECAVLITLGDVQIGLEDYKNAEETANLALIKARGTGSKISISLVLNLFSRVHAAQKKYDEALSFKSAYMAVTDSLHTDETVRDVVAKDLRRVNSDNQILEKRNKSIIDKNSEYVYIITIITLLLVIVGFLLVMYYKRNAEKKAANFLLKDQASVIADANEELNALNEELTTQMDIVSAQNSELEKLNNVKNKFFSIVSHDLRGPINTLKMLFELYREGDLTQKELNEMLSKLEVTIYNTATFLDNLLEWSRSQLEGMVVRPTTFEIVNLVNDNIKLAESQIKLKSLQITNHVPKSTKVFADPNMINTVIRNMLSNAIKFCCNGDSISFDAKQRGNTIVWSISDNGPGIKEADKENLFNLVHSISTGTSGEKGYHIGLLLCKDMVTQNNGTIEVESTLGKGTTFYVTLPIDTRN